MKYNPMGDYNPLKEVDELVSQAKKITNKRKYNGLNAVWDDFKKKFVKKGTLDWNWTKLLDGPLLGDELESQEDKLQRFIDAPDTFII